MYQSTPGNMPVQNIIICGVDCKGAELIGNKQTHKQTCKQSTLLLLIVQISVLSVTKMDVSLLLLASDEKCKR